MGQSGNSADLLERNSRRPWLSASDSDPAENRLALHKGAEDGDRFANDQVLHLIRALVGVKRFGISKETRDAVVGENAVASEQLSRPGDRLTRLGRRERLRKRRLLFRKLAFVRELCDASHHALAGCDVA